MPHFSKTFVSIILGIVLFTSLVYAQPAPIDPIQLMGFNRAHRAGYTGQGQTICVIEQMEELNASQLPSLLQECRQDGRLKIYDCGRQPALAGASNHSLKRHPEEFIEKVSPPCVSPLKPLEQASFRSHEIKTASLALGCAPGIAMNGVHFSNFSYDPPSRETLIKCRMGRSMSGAAIWTYQDMLDYAFDQGLVRSSITPDEVLSREGHRYQASLEQLQALLKKYSGLHASPIDTSLIDAICSATQASKAILSMSITLSSLTDPRLNFAIPKSILTIIADHFEATDAIGILAAGNLEGIESKHICDGYLRSLAQEPRLRDRIVAVINLETDTQPLPERSMSFFHPDHASQLVTMPNQQQMYVRVCDDSNTPRAENVEGGWEHLAICGLGTRILFPDGSSSNGTSLAAPQVAGLCALLWEKHPSMTGPEVVHHIKETAIKLGDPQTFGAGLINPLAALDCGVSSTQGCTLL